RPLDRRATLDDLLFRVGSVHQHDVGLATLGHGERLPGADRNRFHPVARLLLEHWDEHVEQAAILCARRRRQDDVWVLRSRSGTLWSWARRRGAWRRGI